MSRYWGTTAAGLEEVVIKEVVFSFILAAFRTSHTILRDPPISCYSSIQALILRAKIEMMKKNWSCPQTVPYLHILFF